MTASEVAPSERSGRLVGEDRARLVHERPRNRDALPLTAGELVGELPGVVGEPEPAEQLGTALVSVPGAPHGELECDVLDRRQERQEVVDLEDESDLVAADALPIAPGQARDRVARHGDASGGRALEAGDQPEQGRLATPARPGHGEAAAGLDLDADAVDRPDDPGARRVVLRERLDPDAGAPGHRGCTAPSERASLCSARTASSSLCVT